MASHAGSPVGYSYVTYPGADYAMSPGAYPGSPQMAAMAHMEFSGMQHHLPYSPHPHFPANLAFAHLGHPPSPIVTHSLPPSPAHSGHGSSSHSSQRPPSPDARNSSEMKVLRQLCTAMTKLQSTMKDLAERQEQILDRMSLLEQRVGRMDDGVERIIENTEAVMEDSRSIRKRVEESESSENQDAFENRLTDLMDGVVEKLIGGIAEEIRDVKKMVKDTEKYVKFDPFAWSSKLVMAQRMADAALLAEEPQKEVPQKDIRAG